MTSRHLLFFPAGACHYRFLPRLLLLLLLLSVTTIHALSLSNKQHKNPKQLHQRLTQYWSGVVPAGERLTLFPTAAAQVNATHWRVPLHGWCAAPKPGSHKRQALIAALGVVLEQSGIVGSSDGVGNNKLTHRQRDILQQRLRPFLADNKSYRRPKIELLVNDPSNNNENVVVQAPRSLKNGHFKTNVIVRVDTDDAGSSIQSGPNSNDPNINLPSSASIPILSYRAVSADKNKNPNQTNQQPNYFYGQTHLIPPTGVSIISDIDDTLKITHSRDKKRLIRNTFCRDFQVVPGMKDVFTACQERFFANVAFHYVSASPYQLYEALTDLFQHQHQFPPATYHLKTIRPKHLPQTLAEISADPLEYKRGHLVRLLQQYPQRTFYLVGDSGEQDPEIYAALQRDYPQQVAGIWIRRVNDENGTSSSEDDEEQPQSNSPQQISQMVDQAILSRMAGVPREMIQLFDTGHDLLAGLEEQRHGRSKSITAP